MKIYSVDSTKSREKKSSSKILSKAGLDLATSDFQVPLSTTVLPKHVLSATRI